MKQHAQHTRNTLLTVLMAGVAGVGFSTAVTAATAAEVGANPIVSAGAQASSYVDMHMSTTGSAFHNALGQSWEDRGADRAAERMAVACGDGEPVRFTIAKDWFVTPEQWLWIVEHECD